MALFEEGFLVYVNRPLFTSLWLLAFVGFLLQLCVFLVSRKMRQRIRLSPIFELNISLWLIYSLSVLIWQCYIFSFLDAMKRDVYTLFYIGLLMTGSGHSLSLSISMLMLERILIISSPAFHARHTNLIVAFAFLVCGAVAIFIPVNACLRELPLAALTECQTFFCIMRNGSAYVNTTMKTAIGAINLFLTIIFGLNLFVYMSKSHGGSSSKRFRTANLLVCFAATSETTFVILPRAFELTCQVTKWETCSSSYMGYAIQLNTLFTALVYLLILRPKDKEMSSVGQVTVLPSSFGKK